MATVFKLSSFIVFSIRRKFAKIKNVSAIHYGKKPAINFFAPVDLQIRISRIEKSPWVSESFISSPEEKKISNSRTTSNTLITCQKTSIYIFSAPPGLVESIKSEKHREPLVPFVREYDGKGKYLGKRRALASVNASPARTDPSLEGLLPPDVSIAVRIFARSSLLLV